VQEAWLHILWLGLIVTIKLAAITAACSLVLAAVFAGCSISPWRIVRAPARLIVDVLRCIPVLALLIFVYYGLGKYTASWGIEPFWYAVLALTLGEAAFLSEVFRAGLESIPRSQWEAATSLGFRWRAALGYVIAPQVILPSLPGIVNMCIFTIKDSSLASFISVPEVTQTANQLVSETFKPLQVYLMLAGFYLVLILPFTFAAGRVERAIQRYLGLESHTTSMARN
jgi:His/Glu/Gln/Arg/opine family amino acid ABC transporter permease subunit